MQWPPCRLQQKQKQHSTCAKEKWKQQINMGATCWNNKTKTTINPSNKVVPSEASHWTKNTGPRWPKITRSTINLCNRKTKSTTNCLLKNKNNNPGGTARNKNYNQSLLWESGYQTSGWMPPSQLHPATLQKNKRKITISHFGNTAKTKTTINLPLWSIWVPRKQKQKNRKTKQQLSMAAALPNKNNKQPTLASNPGRCQIIILVSPHTHGRRTKEKENNN